MKRNFSDYMKDSLQGPKNNNHDIIVAANIKNTGGPSGGVFGGSSGDIANTRDDKIEERHQPNQES